MINKPQINILKAIGKEAGAHSLKAWVVGGFVRDYYLNKTTKDIDICVEGDFAPLAAFCKKHYGAKIQSFTNFGTARVHLKNGMKLDFVRCRKEVYSQPGALPKVTPSNLKDDLFRRDFTCNAGALSILPGEFFKSYDYYGALDAIKGRYIKILHKESFYDDPTRIFRALRFAGRLNWKLEKQTEACLKKAVKEEAPLIISRERIRQELIKILEEKNSKRIFTLLKKYGADVFIYPKLKWPAAMAKATKVQDKVLLLALAIGNHGGEFLEHLHLPKADYGEVISAWEIFVTKQSPAKELSVWQIKMLKLFAPKLPSSALKKSFLSGGDIQAAGFKGAEIKKILNKLSSLQWKGIIKNKQQALSALKKYQSEYARK